MGQMGHGRIGTRLRRRAGLAALLAVTTVVSIGVAQEPSTAASASYTHAVAAEFAVGHAGRWMTDSAGRVVIIHGVNVPSKLIPAYPAAIGFGPDDAAVLNNMGINAVRLTVERYAVEPSPDRFDPGYVDQIARTVRMLASYGISSLIDFHQDQFGPAFLDNGYPSWMTVTDGLPNNDTLPFPQQYIGNPALNRAFDHLWANDVGPSGRPLQVDDATILDYVATHLRSERGLLGYELINEPWPGSSWPQCLDPAAGCPEFDKGELSAYYARMVAAVRAADPAHMIWYEPLTTFNFGTPTSVRPSADPRLGFAFHVYADCDLTGVSPLPCDQREPRAVANALAHSAATGSALLATEFGATTDTTELANELGLFDENMIPWMFWSYTRYIDKLDADGSLLPATDGNLNQPIVDALTRPYPQLVSGTPRSWYFDVASKTFTFTYSTERANGHERFHAGALTEIEVPALNYRSGYHVAVEGGKPITSPDRPGLVRIAACPGVTSVRVEIKPGQAHPSASCQ